MNEILKELLRAWRKLSLRAKTLVIIGALMNSGSVFSITDSVIKWKGFLRDVLEMYQDAKDYVTPIIESILQVKIKSFHFDYFILHTIMIGIIFGVFLRNRTLFLKATDIGSYQPGLTGILKRFTDAGGILAFILAPVASLYANWFLYFGIFVLFLMYLIPIIVSFLPKDVIASHDDELIFDLQIQIGLSLLFLLIFFFVGFLIFQGICENCIP